MEQINLWCTQNNFHVNLLVIAMCKLPTQDLPQL